MRLSQDNCLIDHPALGRVIWTVVPVIDVGSPPPGSGQQYQVLFS